MFPRLGLGHLLTLDPVGYFLGLISVSRRTFLPEVLMLRKTLTVTYRKPTHSKDKGGSIE